MLGLGEWNVLQVHAIHARDNKGRRGDGTEHSKDLHHLIGAVRHTRQVQLSRTVQQVAMDFDQIQVADEMVVHVPQERREVGPDERELVPQQMTDHIARVGQYSTQLDQDTLQIEDLLEHFRIRIGKRAILHLVYAVADTVDQWLV